MPVYLNERELGYDPTVLGFPSIDSCMAIVLATDTGLFGLHNFGGSARDRWPERTAGLKTFYMRHASRRPGAMLVGVTHVSRRGYEADPSGPTGMWLNELRAFASALWFEGPIRGVNLDARGPGGGSAYVEVRRVGAETQVHVKNWSDADRTLGPVADPNNLKYLTPGGIQAQVRPVVVTMNTAGMVRTDPIRLRG